MHSPILLPVVVLIIWSLVMLGWVVVSRMPALQKAGIDLAKAPPGGRGGDLDGRLPPSVMWKAHNFSHLTEAPTLFYAIALTLALEDAGSGVNLIAAWAYVGLRIAHSLWQALVNTIPVRFTLYSLSTACLVVMAVQALRAAL